MTQNNKTTTTYVCNGAAGAAAAVSVRDEPAGSNCPTGGQAITSSTGGTSVTSDATRAVAASTTDGTYAYDLAGPLVASPGASLELTYADSGEFFVSGMTGSVTAP